MENQELHMKFPCVLRKALETGKVSFSPDTDFEYKEIFAYRVVRRKDENDFSTINEFDFKSQMEEEEARLKANGKPNRNLDVSDIGNYSVSFSLTTKRLENIFKLPKPTKKLIQGFVFCEGGPKLTEAEKQHVHWWIYKDADLSGFGYAKQ